jgi:SAM-dependent methyltransferase
VTTLIDRYGADGRAARLYRRLRLSLAGLEALATCFPDNGLIIDLGCGMGLLDHLLVEGHPRRSVLAVDHDPQRIALLARSAQGLAIEARVDDLATMALPACRGIALVDVLHYLDRPAQEALLERAAAALEPGGVIVLRDPDAAAGWRYLAARLHERIAVGVGWTQARIASFRAAAEWSFLLRAHGLEADVLPLPSFTPYADRTVIGRRP